MSITKKLSDLLKGLTSVSSLSGSILAVTSSGQLQKTTRDAILGYLMMAVSHQAEDVDTIITPGLYEVTYGVTMNAPSGFSDGLLEVIRKGGSTYFHRIMNYNGEMAIRVTSNSGSTWTNWKKATMTII